MLKKHSSLYKINNKIFVKIWPDKIFANKRIAKLNRRLKIDKISIKNNNGNIKTGQPDGKTKKIKWLLYFLIKK